MSERTTRLIEDDVESARLVAQLDETMAALLAPAAPSAQLFERLMAEVAAPPQRYAPFFARLAQLFDLPEDAVIAECARLADPSAWRFAGLPGIKNVVVRGGPRLASAVEVLFARFAPGLRFPRHVHTGVEHVLVMEGSYLDSDGIVHRPGELLTWEPGTRHGFHVGPEPCIAAVVVFGREFEALPLRLLARVLGR